ncbi:phospholipase A1 PLIP2, chloroplastic-like [Phragmites australis]|uniref:phospholipase A1 PLIP2, chloroplastic-like n=1 Tax=Phragmites australis TaxID=29695 RepID=UPI002D7976CD|nr:phospholipase A1 PLIP2, chloroplastic-like [Phragmites australis]
MDALRFVRGAAPPQPPVAPASVPTTAQRRQQRPRATLLRMWPRDGGGGGGGGGVEKPAAAGGSVRGAESRIPPQETAEADQGRQGNWVLQMLRVQPRWVEAADAEATGGGQEVEADAAAAGGGVEECVSCGGGSEEEGCAVGYDEGDGEVFDRASFSRLLRKVSLREAKEYSMMSYLCNIAYMIPRIQPKCLRRYNLRFVTSSVQEKARTSPDEKQENAAGKDKSPDQEYEVVENVAPGSKEKISGMGRNPFGAYQVVSSAASYLHSRAMGITPFGSWNDAKNVPAIMAIVNGENDEASFVATTNSVTSMVAAKEETRQAVADDLNSSRYCPCEWFICDDDESSTRYFVVQGSESIASWQANLLFEPVKFEELDVLVHRGIYEAAKGMYHQMLPYVKSHRKKCGKSAALRFTGHSLGGSLALLVNLMLLMRGEAPASSLLPVITFGAPCIMCGGDHLLRRLGLPRSHVQSITMHRDIVPRVFSCSYPDHVASILKLANGNFRSHPCLTNRKLLYAPMGEVLILQPDERLSPHHHLLPPDSGIYHLGGPSSSSSGVPLAQLRSAVSAFFNSPHPLEILKDGGAYGPRGSVYRDHDVNSYLRSVRAVVRKEARRALKAERERWRLLLWWPFGVHGVSGGGGGGIVDAVLQGGMETARRVRLLVVLLLPAQLLALGALLVVRSR